MSIVSAMRLALLCSALALLLAGCGGSSNRLDYAHFTQAANQICIDLKAQETADPGRDPASAFTKNLAYLQEALGKLEKVNPPVEREADFRKLVTHFRAMVDFIATNEDKLVTLTVYIRDHPEAKKAIDDFQKFVKPFDDDAAIVAQASHDLALPACYDGFKQPD